MPIFEVEVETSGTQWYRVKAKTEAEALEIWREGDFVAEEIQEYVPVNAVEDTFADDSDVRVDPYEPDFGEDEYDYERGW